jgi:hypothetical protein
VGPLTAGAMESSAPFARPGPARRDPHAGREGPMKGIKGAFSLLHGPLPPSSFPITSPSLTSTDSLPIQGPDHLLAS